MSSCMELTPPAGGWSRLKSGVRWVRQDSSTRQDEIPSDNCRFNLRAQYERLISSEEKRAGDYLVELLNACTDEEEDELEKALLHFPAQDLLLAGIENGSDEALAKSRYLLQRLEKDAWAAWTLLTFHLDDYPTADYIGDIASCPVSFPDIAHDVFARLASHHDITVQSLLLENLANISEEMQRPVLIKLTKSNHADIAAEAKHQLVMNGAC